jgi:RNA polymerase sigma-70 factor (ECF subfamily)
MVAVKDSSKQEEMEIIGRILEGDRNAFGILLDRYRDHVFGIVMKRVSPGEAEEVAHEVFIRAFKSLSRFRGESPFSHWLAKVAVRTCHDHWRKRYRNREIPMNSLSEEHVQWIENTASAASTWNHESVESERLAGDVLGIALSRLHPDDRAVVELVHLDEYSIKETSEILGWSQGKVKIRAFRARRKLRKIIEDYDVKGVK